MRSVHVTDAQHTRLLALARSLLVRALAKGEPTTELKELVDVLDVDAPQWDGRLGGGLATRPENVPVASRRADLDEKAERVHRLQVGGQDQAMQEARNHG